jgi:hypothetical protein
MRGGGLWRAGERQTVSGITLWEDPPQTPATRPVGRPPGAQSG